MVGDQKGNFITAFLGQDGNVTETGLVGSNLTDPYLDFVAVPGADANSSIVVLNA